MLQIKLDPALGSTSSRTYSGNGRSVLTSKLAFVHVTFVLIEIPILGAFVVARYLFVDCRVFGMLDDLQLGAAHPVVAFSGVIGFGLSFGVVLDFRLRGVV